MRQLQFVTLIVLFNAVPVLADQVSLKNGDRLTGTIVQSDGKTLVLHTEYAGDLTLKWDAVKGIESSEALHVELQNGKTAIGPVATSDDTLKIATASGEVTAPVSSVKGLSQQAAYQKLEHPNLLLKWAGSTPGFPHRRQQPDHQPRDWFPCRPAVVEVEAGRLRQHDICN